MKKTNKTRDYEQLFDPETKTKGDIKDCSPEIEARITQCAVIAYFKPKSDAIYRTAKMISPSEYKSWIPELEKLRRGEFIATGNLLVGNVEYDYPVRVTG